MKTTPSFRSCASIASPLPPPASAVRWATGSWRARTGWLSFCLGALLLCGGINQAQGQNVSLGNAVFAATSDQIPADWYWPMPASVTFTYDGYGTLEGATRTETYVGGQWIAGVKTVKWHAETVNSGSSAATVEDWWLALDVDGNLRVLQIVQGGSTTFVASGQKTPPVYLPAIPAKGQTWDLLGNTATIEEVIASANFKGAVKLSITSPGSDVETHQYSAGTGLVQDATNQNAAQARSGWSLRPPALRPQ